MQVAPSVSSRRSLAASGPAEDPEIFPNGGIFHDPIAVSLVSGDGVVVFYTVDGTTPDESSSFVTSDELIVLEEPAQIRAVAAPGRDSFGAYSSAEVQANFVVYTIGAWAPAALMYIASPGNVEQCSYKRYELRFLWFRFNSKVGVDSRFSDDTVAVTKTHTRALKLRFERSVRLL